MSEVIKLPGEEEAALIVKESEVVASGIIAWVNVGLRMIDVQTRLPYGQFSKWVEKHLVQRVALSRRHLFQAKAVADFLLEKHNLDRDAAIDVVGNENYSLWNDVYGKSTRQLTFEVREEKQSLVEQEAKLWCEVQWKEDGELRDRFEPRILSGELSYVGAKAAMIGLEHGTDEDGKRPATNFSELIRKNFEGAARNFKAYEELKDEQKEAIHESAMNFAKSCPPALAKMIKENLPN